MQQEKTFDMDSFGEIMEDFIRKNALGLLVTKKENSEEWDVTGVGGGAVMDFYIFLNAIEPLFLRLLDEMKRINAELDAEHLADAMAEMIKKGLMAAAEEA